MSLDFSNYLVPDSSNTCPGCLRKWNSDDASGGESGSRDFERWTGSDVDGMCRCNGSEVQTGNGLNDVVSRDRRDDTDSRSGVFGEDSNAPKRKSGMTSEGPESLKWNAKLELASRHRIRIQDRSRGSVSLQDLSRHLGKVETFPDLTPDSAASSDETPQSQGHDQGQGQGRVEGSLPTLRDPRQSLYRTRKSLPDRLTDDHVTSAKREARKRYGRRGSVKFADDCGLNLNTFVMIPSRYAFAHAQQEVTSSASMGATDGCGAGGRRFDRMSIRDLGLNDDDDSVFWPDWNSSEMRCIRRIDRKIRNGNAPDVDRLSSRKIFRSDRQQETRTMTSSGSAQSKIKNCDHEFRLCFEQPFADLENFQRKLRANFLSLENVRVDDRWSRSAEETSAKGSTGHSRSNDGTTILCSIKVRRTYHPRTVFARCTDDDWGSYADLPGQLLSGVNNLGLEYDTYCFAVRKPVRPPRSESARETWRGKGGATSAVEFAVCAVFSTPTGSKSYWDNNDNSNYRIEWFD